MSFSWTAKRVLLVVGLGLSLFFFGRFAGHTIAASSGRPATGSNPIVVENQQPGSSLWQIPSGPGFQIADDTNNQIKGYASETSVNQGDSITFYVTVNPAQSFTLSIFRMGWYGGLGGRLMQTIGPISGTVQPVCPVIDSSTSLMACNWAPSYTLAIPSSWTDGIYLAVLTNGANYQNYVPFVVRDDARVAALLYQQSVNTYQAYNNWGGKSLYGYNSSDGARAYKVSFDRPYADDGSGDYFGWEVYFVQWLEENGYDVTYSTDVDTDGNANRLLGVKGFLVVGHDEYWTKAMYDAAQNARDAGVSLGFFGANAIYWQARYEPSATGVANRVLVSYKTSDTPNSIDPITATDPTLTTDLWRNPLPNRPEQALIGVQFTSQVGTVWSATVPYVVANSGNWVYAGSGLVDGDSIAGITGYETDRLWSGYPIPDQTTSSLLAESPYTDVSGGTDQQNASIYQALSGAWVFAAGTMSWSWALAEPGFIDPRIQQATTNVLNAFLTNVPVAVTATPTQPPPPTPTTAPSAYYDAVMASQPLAYWRLDESGGTLASDHQGTYDGTYIASPTLGATGAIAGDPDAAVSFDGASQFVDVPYSVGLNPATFSVEAWAEPSGGDGAYRGVIASRTYPQGWALYAGGDWEFWINSGAGMLVLSGGSVVDNCWTHLVATFDGTTASLYVDGSLVDSATVDAYQPQTINALTIGQSQPASNFWFPGTIDEAALYGRALSAVEVQNHYLLGSACAPPTVTATPTPSATATPTATSTWRPSATATATPRRPSPSPTATPSRTPTASPSFTATATSSATASATATATATPSRAITPTATASPEPTPGRPGRAVNPVVYVPDIAVAPPSASSLLATAAVPGVVAKTEQLHQRATARLTREDVPRDPDQRWIAPEQALSLVRRAHGTGRVRWIGLTSSRGKTIYRVRLGSGSFDVDAVTGVDVSPVS
jgi:hypothetical protein